MRTISTDSVLRIIIATLEVDIARPHSCNSLPSLTASLDSPLARCWLDLREVIAHGCFVFMLRIPGFGIRRASPPLDAIPPEAIFYLQCIHCRPIKASKVCVSRRNHLKYLCKSTLVSRLHVNKHKIMHRTRFSHPLSSYFPRGVVWSLLFSYL